MVNTLVEQRTCLATLQKTRDCWLIVSRNLAVARNKVVSERATLCLHVGKYVFFLIEYHFQQNCF